MLYGAGTDYCLFLISRYREELSQGHDRETALVLSVKAVGGALVASAGTVICGLGLMVLAEFAKVRCGGPAIAIGLCVALAASLTLAPALLRILGPVVFWPMGLPAAATSKRRDLWTWISDRVIARPMVIWGVVGAAAAAPGPGWLPRQTQLQGHRRARRRQQQRGRAPRHSEAISCRRDRSGHRAARVGQRLEHARGPGRHPPLEPGVRLLEQRGRGAQPDAAAGNSGAGTAGTGRRRRPAGPSCRPYGTTSWRRSATRSTGACTSIYLAQIRDDVGRPRHVDAAGRGPEHGPLRSAQAWHRLT